MNGGTCTDGIGTFSCDCTNTGFCGTTCADAAFAVQTQHGGQCPCEDDATWVYSSSSVYNRAGGHQIGCDALTLEGYVGRYDVKSCDQLTGTDGVAASRACKVACAGGDVTACPEYDNCWDSPCLNGGVCTDGTPSFTCDCTNTGFCGRTCADPAFAVQAQHGGQCPCEDDVTSCQAYDNCWNSPCLNGGVCTDGLGTFTCACPAHYGGAACQLYSGPNQDWVSARLCAVRLWLLSQLRSGAACWRFACAVPRQRDVGWLSKSALSTRWI